MEMAFSVISLSFFFFFFGACLMEPLAGARFAAAACACRRWATSYVLAFAASPPQTTGRNQNGFHCLKNFQSLSSLSFVYSGPY